MAPIIRRLAIMSAVVAIAAGGGIALGNFALVGPAKPGEQANGQAELQAEIANLYDKGAASDSPSRAPDHYVCQGCDAGRASNGMVDDGFQPYDTTPLPPYHPRDAMVDEAPVLAADRSAPDALRRRAASEAGTPPHIVSGGAPAAYAALPVLEADRKPAATVMTRPVSAPSAGDPAGDGPDQN